MDVISSTNMFSAGLDAAGWGLDFPAMRYGREDAGFGVGMDDPFFLESVEEPLMRQ